MKSRPDANFAGRFFLWQLVLAALFINLLAQGIHEVGHWSVYMAAGLRPVWGLTGLVQVWDSTPQHPEQWLPTTSPEGEQGWLRLSSAPTRFEESVALAAGPFASLAAAVLGLLYYHFGRRPSGRLFSLLLTIITALVMTIYYIRSPMRSGGDEGFLAALLGIPKLALDLPLGLAFLACLGLGLHELQGWRNGLRWLGAVVLGMLPGGMLLFLLDPLIRSGVAAGNPAFQPVLGFSLPALLVYVLAAIGSVLVSGGISRRSSPDPRSGPR